MCSILVSGTPWRKEEESDDSSGTDGGTYYVSVWCHECLDPYVREARVS